MARRKTIWTPEIVRQRIKASQLLNVLQDHVLGKGDKKRELSLTQLKAATFLLSRMVAPPNEAQDLNVNGNLTCVFRDPTDRPIEMNGYHRKPALHDGD